MSYPEPITQWLQQLASGEETAARRLWELYFDRMANLARRRLAGTEQGARDHEDVALSAFASFCKGVARGRYPNLKDHESLWRLLVRITVRKALDLIDYNCRRPSVGESALAAANETVSWAGGMDAVPGLGPGPELVALINEQFEQLLELLPRPCLKQVALWSLENYTNAEIAAKLGRKVRTVERYLAEIRDIWGERLPS
jgi:DNA-directed RNA polymerase specialized sigma24 family protein